MAYGQELLLGGSKLDIEGNIEIESGSMKSGNEEVIRLPTSIERYVAVDPGVTTGFVLCDLPSNWRSMDLYRLLSSYASGGNEYNWCRQLELHGTESWQIDQMEALILGRKGRAISAHSVVIEDFILRQRTQDRSLLAPVRVGAMLTDRLYSKGFQGQIVWQSPSDAKSIVTDTRLKSWGLWHIGSPHIRDAWRHLTKYLREQR